MLEVFSEFERAMIRDRGMAGLDRRTVIWQAIGQATDDPIQRQPYPCCAGSRARRTRDGTVAEGECRQGQ
jgi:hypothetical protein